MMVAVVDLRLLRHDHQRLSIGITTGGILAHFRLLSIIFKVQILQVQIMLLDDVFVMSRDQSRYFNARQS